MTESFQAALLPPRAPTDKIQLQSNIHEFADKLLAPFNEETPFDAASIAQAQEVFTKPLFAAASCYGSPKLQMDNKEMFQTVFSGATLGIIYDNMSFYMECVSTLVDELVNATITFEDDLEDPEKEAYFMQQCGFIVAMSQIIIDSIKLADANVVHLPKAYNLRQLAPNLQEFADGLGVMVESANQIIEIKKDGDNVEEDEEDFAAIVQEVRDIIPKLTQLPAVYLNNLSKRFAPNFSEPPYADYQTYLYDFANHVANLIVSSVLTAQFDKDAFPTILSVLKHFSDNTYDMVSTMTGILRFRGNLEQGVRQAKQDAERIGDIFRPLIQSLSQCIPFMAPGLGSNLEQRIIRLFQELQDLHMKFPEKTDILVGFLKKDRRYALLKTVENKPKEAPPEVKAAVPLSQAATTLSKLATKPGCDNDQLTEAISKLSDAYNDYNETITDAINNENDPERKLELLGARDDTAAALQSIAENFQKLQEDPENDNLKQMIGQDAVEMILALDKTGDDPVLDRNMLATKQTEGDACQNYPKAVLPAVLKDLQEINGKLDQMPAENKDDIAYLAPQVMKEAMNVEQTLNRNPRTNVPEQVLENAKAIEKLADVLDSLATKLDPESEEAKRMQEEADALHQLADNTKLVMSNQYDDAAEKLADDVERLCQAIGEENALQDDSNYILNAKGNEELRALADEVKKAVNDHGSSGTYDPEHVKKVDEAVNKLLDKLNEPGMQKELDKLQGSDDEKAPIAKDVIKDMAALNALHKPVSEMADNTMDNPETLAPGLQEDIKDMEEKYDAMKQALAGDPLEAGDATTAYIVAAQKVAEKIGRDQSPEAQEIRSNLEKPLAALNEQTLNGESNGELDNAKLAPILAACDQAIADAKRYGDAEDEKYKAAVAEDARIRKEKEDAANAPITDTAAERRSEIPETQTDFSKEMMDAMQCQGTAKPLAMAYAKLLDELGREFAEKAKEYEGLDHKDDEKLAELQALHDVIAQVQQNLNNALNHTPSENPKDDLRELLKEMEKLPRRERRNLFGKLAGLIADMIAENEEFEDEIKIVQDIIEEAGKEPDQAIDELMTLAKAMLDSPESVTQQLIDEIREDLAKGDEDAVKEKLPQLIIADRVFCDQNMPGSDPFNQDGTPQSDLKKIKDDGHPLDDKDKLLDVLKELEKELTGAYKDPDVNGDIAGQAKELEELANKKSDAVLKGIDDKDDPAKVMNDLKRENQALYDLAMLAALAAAERGDLSPEDQKMLDQEIMELNQLMDEFNQLAEEYARDPDNFSEEKKKRMRALAEKIRAKTGKLAELCDQIAQKEAKKPLTPKQKANNLANKLLASLLKKQKAASETNPDVKNDVLPDAKDQLAKDADEFITFMKDQQKQCQDPAIADELAKLIEQFEKVLEEVKNSDNADPAKTAELVDLMQKMKDTLDKAKGPDVVPDEAAAAKLPYQFNFTPPPYSDDVPPLAETKKQIDEKQKKAQKSHDALCDKLDNPSTPSSEILNAYNQFQNDLNELLAPVELYKRGLWNPKSQAEVEEQKKALIASGDETIEATRARLLGEENWKENVARTRKKFGVSMKGLHDAIDDAMNLADEDMAKTTEAERELVNAAKSISANQQKLEAMKESANTGATPFAQKVIDLVTPILAQSADLIQAAQEQTQYVLKHTPEITNTRGLTRTANELIQSLDLLIKAAQQITDKDTGGESIARVLGASALLSGATARFIAEAGQKNGDPAINDKMYKVVDQIQGSIADIRGTGEKEQETVNKSDQQKQLTTIRKTKNKIIKTRNSETAINKARKDMEEAEEKLKSLRRFDAKGSVVSREDMMKAEANVIENKRRLKVAESVLEEVKKDK